MSSNGHNSALSPQLKSWLDNVVVPALVRDYLAQQEAEKVRCNGPKSGADSPAKSTATIGAGGSMP
jgi:hypothetical protein